MVHNATEVSGLTRPVRGVMLRCKRYLMRDFLEARAVELEGMLNWVSDHDREWWPFLFLRPAPEQRMGSLQVALFSALHGVFWGMLANALVAITSRGDAAQLSVVTLPACTTVAFFVVFRLTFAHCWNRRARRLGR